MSSRTLAQVIDTEKATKSLQASYEAKRQSLVEDKNRKISEWESEKENELKSFKQSQEAKNQDFLGIYQSEEKGKNDQEIQEMVDKFQDSLPELVSFVVGEVKNSYGNR